MHVMKMDIEGYEPKALRGAIRLLTSSKPPCYIIIEFNSNLLRMAGETDIMSGVNMLLDLGYELYSDSYDGVFGAKKFGEDESFQFSNGYDYEFRWGKGRCIA